MRILFLFFILVPIVEIMVLIEVGNRIGTWETAFLVVLTAVIGSFMLRQQGLSTLFQAQQRMRSGEMPINEVVQGLLLAVGGALLLTPGFVTDAIGFACLLPFSRYAIAAAIIKRVQVSSMTYAESSFYAQQGPQQHGQYRQCPPGAGMHGQECEIIEGEFEKEAEDQPNDVPIDDALEPPIEGNNTKSSENDKKP